MDLQVLGIGPYDPFALTKIVDDFETFIWTERYSDAGDFVITMPLSSPNKGLFVPKRWITIPESVEMGRVETVEEQNDILTVTGSMLTAFLKKRAFLSSLSTEHYSVNATSGQAIANVLNLSVIPGGGGEITTNQVWDSGFYEVIAGLSLGTIANDGAFMRIAVEYGTLFDAVKTIADLDNIGFRMYPNSIFPSVNLVNYGYTLLFDSYRGLDRTSSQSNNSAVVFDSALDSLTNLHSYKSIEGYATHAFVIATGATSPLHVGSAVVSSLSDSTADFDRHTIWEMASDINVSDYLTSGVFNATGKALLAQRARNLLVKNNYVKMLDGTLVPQKKDYVFGIDYNLGDIVELRSTTSDKARITEYIRSSSSVGEQSYPTLSVI